MSAFSGSHSDVDIHERYVLFGRVSRVHKTFERRNRGRRRWTWVEQDFDGEDAQIGQPLERESTNDGTWVTYVPFLWSVRLSLIYSSVSMSRYTLKDFTFSDGTTVPAGTLVATASHAIHHDEVHIFSNFKGFLTNAVQATYPDADTFRAFRFSEMRDTESLKHHMVTPNLDYLLFGHGRHACPGRFFAVNELKAMMAHLLLTYDVKLENEGVPPPPRWFGPALIPDGKAEVMFRARTSWLWWSLTLFLPLEFKWMSLLLFVMLYLLAGSSSDGPGESYQLIGFELSTLWTCARMFQVKTLKLLFMQ